MSAERSRLIDVQRGRAPGWTGLVASQIVERGRELDGEQRGSVGHR